MIRHVFAWRIAPGQNHQEILDLLNTLPEKLPIIKYWEIGVHQGDPSDNGAPWDGVLISDFESWDALDEYSNDAYHVSVVENLTPRFASRAVVDFERTDA
ncbi:MAG: Dabb family protein [Actinobacteria bacterium]|nr:Dabb family protein [Actinomycetota bacterium]